MKQRQCGNPPATSNHQPAHTHTNSRTLLLFFFLQEFEIIMVKQQGSLGFTLRKEDESVLGHYVRALVREPATTDGRIKPGDKIVAVSFLVCHSNFSLKSNWDTQHNTRAHAKIHRYVRMRALLSIPGI